MGSFYDLNYVIEINEKRLLDDIDHYQKNSDRFNTVLILYSLFSIFRREDSILERF